MSTYLWSHIFVLSAWGTFIPIGVPANLTGRGRTGCGEDSGSISEDSPEGDSWIVVGMSCDVPGAGSAWAFGTDAGLGVAQFAFG